MLQLAKHWIPFDVKPTKLEKLRQMELSALPGQHCFSNCAKKTLRTSVADNMAVDNGSFVEIKLLLEKHSISFDATPNKL